MQDQGPTGLLVSVEGINGVGKTHRTRRALAGLAGDWLCLDGFTERARSPIRDLGREILRALIDASGRDPFLRAGYPSSETLLLLTIKAYDWEEQCEPALQSGMTVVEGRSLDSVAVYQSLILHPGDDRAARAEAEVILEVGRSWRPLPDLTVLIVDKVDVAIARLESRDGVRCESEQRRMHHRADHLYRELAAEHPERFRVLDRTTSDSETIARNLRRLISGCSPADLAT